MPRESTRSMLDRLIPEGIDEHLKARRAAGLSIDDIAYELRVAHNISVTAEAVRRWCVDLGISSRALRGEVA